MIDIRRLKKVYSMTAIEVIALDDITFKIAKGEFVAIMGPSGSGKSTLMHILGCLDRPTAGLYYLDNQDISRASDNKLAVIRNQKIGFVFQQFNLLGRISALNNVEVPLIYGGISKRKRQSLAKAALEKVGLGDRIHHRPNEVSGGQKQRVAIARALINNPSILLADEPTGALDTKTGNEIMNIFHQLNEMGHTIIVVTHEEDVAKQAKRIIRLLDGRIITDQQVAKEAMVK